MKRLTFFMLSLLLSISMGFAQGGAVVTVEKNIHDFGSVLEANGDVSYNFVVKNTGDAPLVMNRVNASCGCTTPQWTKEPIAPGKTGNIKVTYSVKGRIGPFSKTITIYSNDPKGTTTLVIKGEVLKEKPNVEKTHPVAMDELRLNKNSVDFNVLKNDESKTEYVEIFNAGSMPLTLKFDNVPSYLSIATEPVAIQPDKKGKIKITYNANLVKDYGFIENNMNVIVNSNTKDAAKNIFTIYAKIIDNFDNLTSQQKQEAPRFNMSPISIDLANSKSSQLLKIANSGKSDLLIKSIKPTSNAISISGGKKEVKPGEIVEFKVSVQSGKMGNELNEQINIVTNDPNNSLRDVRVIAKR